jgi:hypothetical protein
VAPGAAEVVVPPVGAVPPVVVPPAVVVVGLADTVDPAGTVGTVLGCCAVFQVAVVGQGVAATVGEAEL